MTASPAEQLSPTPPPHPTVNPFGIGFRQPAPPPLSETIPSPASSPETAAAGEEEELPGPGSGPGELPGEPSDPHAGTSSKASTRGADKPLDSVGLRDTFRAGVLIASHQAHTYLGRRTEAQAQVQLYLADEQDAERIGDPLARIAGRRDGVGQMSPDTQDLMAAMMGLAGYAAKQIEKQAYAARVDARAARGEVLPEPEDM